MPGFGNTRSEEPSGASWSGGMIKQGQALPKVAAVATIEQYEKLAVQGKSETLSREKDFCYMALEGLCDKADGCDGNYLTCDGDYEERRDENNQ